MDITELVAQKLASLGLDPQSAYGPNVAMPASKTDALAPADTSQNTSTTAASSTGVSGLYRDILGRDPYASNDAAGAAYWEQRFGPTIEPHEIAEFKAAAQPELAARSEGLVNTLYDTNLGREKPETQGAADYWTNRIKEVGVTQATNEFQTAAAAEKSAGGGGRKTIDPSKSTVSENFIGLVNRMNEIGYEAAMQEYQEFSGTRYAPQNDIEKAIFASLSGSQTPTSFQKSLDAFTNVLNNLKGTSYDPTKATTGLDEPIELSPYTQAVVDVAKRKAKETSAEAGAREMAQLAKAGAFGSSGADLLKAQRAKNLENLQSDIQAQGLQAAYESALAQRVKESALELDAQRLSETSKQFGAELGLKGLAQELAAAQGLTNLGQAEGAYGLGYGGLQLKGAEQQRNVQQQPYDFGYQQWIESRNYPYQQATFLNTLMRGMPVQAPTYNSGQDPFSTLLQGLLFGYGMTQPPK